MNGSCAVVIVHTEDLLSIDHFLFYGGEIDEAMPPIDGNKPSIVPGRRDANGNRKIRGHYRDIKRSQFKKMSTASELLDALFG